MTTRWSPPATRWTCSTSAIRSTAWTGTPAPSGCSPAACSTATPPSGASSTCSRSGSPKMLSPRRKAAEENAEFPCGFAPLRELLVRQNVHDVAILDDVDLAFQAIDALGLGLFHRADSLELFKGNDLGADETLGE